MQELTPRTVDKSSPLRNRTMGHPDPQKFRTQSFALLLRHEHDPALQGAAARASLPLNGQVRATSSRPLSTRYVRR